MFVVIVIVDIDRLVEAVCCSFLENSGIASLGIWYGFRYSL